MVKFLRRSLLITTADTFIWMEQDQSFQKWKIRKFNL